MDIARGIHGHIVGSGRWWGPPDALTNDLRLIDDGVLDSMAIFELVSFVEDEYGIELEDDELMPETFESIDALARLVSRKLGG